MASNSEARKPTDKPKSENKAVPGRPVKLIAGCVKAANLMHSGWDRSNIRPEKRQKKGAAVSREKGKSSHALATLEGVSQNTLTE